jgi:acetylornithine deacetylase/succinyl-diaminopimelate desuccinylase-like protein
MLRHSCAAGRLAALLILLCPIRLSGQAAPDFHQARDETVRILQALIRIDTSNPPGNETRLAEHLKAILDREGVRTEIVALEPARGNLIARVPGNGRKKPILLTGHMDTVGVERGKWTVDPFEGGIQDGYLYGRGARDDKDDLAAMLEVLLLIHRQLGQQELVLDRDIVFLAVAGEEGSPQVGMDYVVERHWPKVDSEFALNEGGSIHQSDGKVRYVAVGTAQKALARARLVARGVSGHGSVPRMDNAIGRVAAAVAKLVEFQPPMRLNETTRTFFERLATISPPEEAFLFTHLDDPRVGKLVEEALRRSGNRAYVTYNSMLRTSITPTIIQGGFRNNVIPAEAEATLDIRALPDENLDAFFAELRRVVDDPAVEVIALPRYRPIPPIAPLGSEMFRALEKAQSVVFPGAITLPEMSTGSNDAAQLLARGVQAYGVGAPGTDEDAEGYHGNDERVSVEALGQYVEFLYRAVVEVAGAR